MALTNKKYTRIYSSDGNDADKIDSDKITKIESDFNSNSYLKAFGQFDMLAPVLHILQKLTEEIDYLRTEISTNKDKTGSSDAANGKKLYHKAAKPMACKMCHGEKGDGGGKLGKALKPRPRNFSCSETMKNVSPGQMFHIIKNGSPGTGMAAHGKTLKDKEIWDLIKYIRLTFAN